MAKNDYHVIVYRILLYLYTCLKGGEDVFDYQLDRHCSKTQLPCEPWA